MQPSPPTPQPDSSPPAPSLPPPAASRSPLLSRRRVLQLTGTGAVGATGLGYSVGYEPHNLQVTRRDLPVRNLPRELIDRTLCQISDLHVGPIVSYPYLQHAAAVINRLAPDLLVVTGDLMTCVLFEQVEPVTQLLASTLKRPPLGIISILGNHDYGASYHRVACADALTKALRAHRITVLRNQQTVIEGLKFAGVDDLWSPCFDPWSAMHGIEPNDPAIVLVHNPDAADHRVWNGFGGWMLCGHTHGGQCVFPLIGAPILPVDNRRYVSGEYTLADGRRLYISRGVGYLFRIRFNCPPEITLFKLTRA